MLLSTVLVWLGVRIGMEQQIRMRGGTVPLAPETARFVAVVLILLGSVVAARTIYYWRS